MTHINPKSFKNTKSFTTSYAYLFTFLAHINKKNILSSLCMLVSLQSGEQKFNLQLLEAFI